MASYEYDSQNQELHRIAGGTLYADMAIGSEIEYAGTTAPTGFLKCDGSTYSQVTYPELYAILGTTTLPNKSGYIIKAKQIGVPADFASAIEDVIEEKFSYSTSEVNTGKKSTDGKTIYRISFVDKTNAWSSSDQRVGTITNLGRVESVIANAVSANGEAVTNYSNGGTICLASVKMSTGEVAFYRANLSDSTNYWKTVTVEYTKTTD